MDETDSEVVEGEGPLDYPAPRYVAGPFLSMVPTPSLNSRVFVARFDGDAYHNLQRLQTLQLLDPELIWDTRGRGGSYTEVLIIRGHGQCSVALEEALKGVELFVFEGQPSIHEVKTFWSQRESYWTNAPEREIPNNTSTLDTIKALRVVSKVWGTPIEVQEVQSTIRSRDNAIDELKEKLRVRDKVLKELLGRQPPDVQRLQLDNMHLSQQLYTYTRKEREAQYHRRAYGMA